MIFIVLSLHDVGHLSKSPLAIGTLVPLDPSNNQMCFVYVGLDCPSYQVLKAMYKHAFVGKIDYLSKSYFI